MQAQDGRCWRAMDGQDSPRTRRCAQACSLLHRAWAAQEQPGAARPGNPGASPAHGPSGRDAPAQAGAPGPEAAGVADAQARAGQSAVQERARARQRPQPRSARPGCCGPLHLRHRGRPPSDGSSCCDSADCRTSLARGARDPRALSSSRRALPPRGSVACAVLLSLCSLPLRCSLCWRFRPPPRSCLWRKSQTPL